MLIINADDWGINKVATDNSLLCFEKRRITSASAMVFMEDSQRAADLALEHGIDVGLHLNLTVRFCGKSDFKKLSESQQRISLFLNSNKYYFLLYNPFLKKDFEYICNAQYEEFVRLYKKEPSHIDGHHHMHLCTNILVDRLIPMGSKVRRNHAFLSGEKPFLNRLYRCTIDRILMRRYTCTDFFFGIRPYWKTESLQRIVNLAKDRNVELGVHPARKEELEYLLGNEYYRIISVVEIGDYGLL